jgi:hypothetical protein
MKRAAMALALLFLTGTAVAAVAGTWKVVASPTVGGERADDRLSAGAVISADEVWAVGSSPYVNGGSTLTQHWDGSAWRIVSSPNAALKPNGLSGVSAISANDVWAVGSSGGAAGPEVNTLAEHWDGARWSIVPTPNPGLSNVLSGVAAISPADAWAVGHVAGRKTGNWEQALALHWDGRRWSTVATPRLGLQARLIAVSAVSADDVWAVGVYRESGGNWKTVTMHWDGTKWVVVPSPNIGAAANSLSSVVALASNDVWAVGSFSGQTLTLHWDGAKWSVVPSPNVDGAGNGLNAVTAVSTADLWAVGISRTQGSTGGSTTFYTFRTLTMHWDGASWSIVSSPNPSVSVGPTSVFNVLSGAAAVATDDIWAVGYYSNGNAIEPLIERYTVP